MAGPGKCPDCGHIHADAKAWTGFSLFCHVKCEACGQRNHHSDVWIRNYREDQSRKVANSNPGGRNRVWVTLDERIVTWSDVASHVKIVIESSASFTALEISGHDGGISGGLRQIIDRGTVNRVWQTPMTKEEFDKLKRKVLVGFIPSPMTVDEFMTTYVTIMDQDRAKYELFTHNCRSTVDATLDRAIQNKDLLLDEDFAEKFAAADNKFITAVDMMLYAKTVRLPDECCVM